MDLADSLVEEKLYLQEIKESIKDEKARIIVDELCDKSKLHRMHMKS